MQREICNYISEDCECVCVCVCVCVCGRAGGRAGGWEGGWEVSLGRVLDLAAEINGALLQQQVKHVNSK